MALTITQLLVAVYDTLSSDATLLALGLNGNAVTVSDVPAGQCHTFPLVTIGDVSARNDDTKTSNGWAVDGRIHCWSEYQGSKEWAQIIDRCHELLHHQCLTVVGSDNWLVFCTGIDNVLEPDGITRHGILSYTARIAGSP